MRNIVIGWLVVGLFFAVGCGGDGGSVPGGLSDQAAARETATIVHVSDFQSVTWPAELRVEVGVASVQELYSGGQVPVLEVLAIGADQAFGMDLGDISPKLTYSGGGGYTGPRFVESLTDGTDKGWTMLERGEIVFQPFERSGDGWRTIMPLSWICRGVAGERYGISLEGWNESGGKSTVLLNIAADYLVVKSPEVIKYLPASHGWAIEIACP